MEKLLSALFDYQKFEKNQKLQGVIDSTRKRQRQLIMDDTELVTAAGSPYQKPDLSKDDPKDHLT